MNKVSVVTGGGSEIRKACALLMAEKGAKVVVAECQEHQLKNIVIVGFIFSSPEIR